jgi:anaerobic selenocysteine-containing dehydrogenase
MRNKKADLSQGMLDLLIRGSFVAAADITDRVRKGVVASAKGRWPRHTKEGATVNATVDERDSDIGGGAVFHDNRVEVERVSG